MKNKLLLIAITLCFNAAAQSVTNFNYISIDNGLSNNTVEGLIQDSRGFIWMGTGYGINVYNGYNFKSFSSDHPFRKMRNSYVYAMMEDSKKRIWIGMGTGASLYNDTLDIIIYKDQPIINVDKSNSVHAFFETADHTILTCTNYGINKYDENLKQFVRFTPPDLLKYGIDKLEISRIIKDSKNNYWIATRNDGIYIYNSKFIFQKALKAGDIESNHVSSMVMDNQGNVWVGYSDEGLDCISAQFQRLRHYSANTNNNQSLSANVIKCLLKDSQNNIWIGTENGGVNVLNTATNEITCYKSTPYNVGGLSQNTVISLMEDRQQNIWIGTIKGGVNVFSIAKNRFKFFTSGYGPSNLSFKNIASFFESRDGTVYVSTDGGGLNVWNRNKNQFTYYQYKKGQNSISSDAVLCSFEDSENNIWVGTWAGGLNHFDPKTKKFTVYKNNPNDPSSISSDNVWFIIESDDHLLWIGTSLGGVNIFNPKTKKFTRFLHGKNNRGTIYGNNIRSLIKDHDGNIWIGTQDGGLNRYDTRNGLITHYFIFYEKSQLRYLNIKATYCDVNGDIWVSLNNGLYKYDKVANKFLLFSKNTNINSASINSITDDNFGNLWCGTQNGILKINKHTQATDLYTLIDGLQGTEFPRNACLKLRSGELLFGGQNGFNLFKPNSITKNNIPPNVYITNILVLNEPVYPSTKKNAILKEQVFDNGSIVLTHKQAAFLTIEFAAINYISTRKNKYAYQLEGYDDRMIPINNQRRVSFTNLNPGNYRLKVIASNNDNVWNKKGAVLNIKILPPFWKTWWFTLILSIIILSIIVAYFRMYQNLIHRKINDKKQEELRTMQLDFFTHVSHEFRTPLTLIRGASEKIQEKAAGYLPEKYFSLLNRNIAKMSDMVNEIMDFRKLESGDIKLNVSLQNINLIIKQIAEDFLPLAERKNIDYNIQLNTANNNETYFDPTFIERIASNLLNNAFKYTQENGKISIQITEDIQEFNPIFEDKIAYYSEEEFDKYIYLIVKDSGIGIADTSLQQIFNRFYRVSNDQLGSGVGLAFVRKLTLLHKGFIKLYSKKNKGTHIIIGIPKLEKYYTENERKVENKNSETPTFESPATPQYILPQLNTKPTPIKKETAESTSKEYNILIVDDNEDIRNFLTTTFADTYNIYEAENGVIGLEKARQLIPHLIITDVMMPEMNGMELSHALKNDEITNHIPIIMLTARDDDMSKVKGAESGADYYFTKPISIKILSATINNLFSRNTKYKSKFLADYQQEMRSSISNAKDREIIESLLLIIDNEIDNPELDIPFICKSIGMSKSSLFKTIKNATGKSLSEFIRSTRLQKAKYIMINEKVPVNEVMFRVGISSASYFTKSFKTEFGVLPSHYKQ